MDIREFLEARIEEDEAAAREVPERCRSWSLAASATVFDGEDDWYVIDQRNARHIIRHDPARVLRDVEAKRRILAAYVDDDRLRFGDWETCSDSCPVQVLDEVVKLLALAYSDHPDYDPSWSPS